MMREISHVRQDRRGLKRRWFTDDRWDLYVWEEHDRIAGFQLCYGKDAYERALTWMEGESPYHAAIDNGSIGGANRRHAPILVADGVMPIRAVADRFRVDSTDIDPAVRDYVITRLERLQTEYPEIGA